MRRWQKIIAVTLAVLICLWIPSTAFAADWITPENEEDSYGPSYLKEGECFDITPREFVKRFNEKNSANGEWMEFIEEGSKCNLYWGKEQMNIFLQFIDTTDSSLQLGSGLDRDNWNKVKAYIDTDDIIVDEEYLSSFAFMLFLFSDVLNLHVNENTVKENMLLSGGNKDYPAYVFEDQGIRYTLESYDNSAMYFGDTTTTYAVSIEKITSLPDSYVESGKFSLSAQEYADRLQAILGDRYSIKTRVDTSAGDAVLMTEIQGNAGTVVSIIYGGRDYFTTDPEKTNAFDLMTVLLMEEANTAEGFMNIGNAIIRAIDPRSDTAKVLNMLSTLLEDADGQGTSPDVIENGIKYNCLNMGIGRLLMISVDNW